MKVDLCRHIKTNGLQCHGAALTASVFCYFHNRLHRSHDLYRDKAYFQSAKMMDHPFVLQLPAIEDRESTQLAISTVINALATGCIDRKDANSLFYGLQLASANARGLCIVRRPTQLVREVCKESWTAVPETNPDIAPPGRTCEIEDPAESESTDPPEFPQPPIETAALAVVQNSSSLQVGDGICRTVVELAMYEKVLAFSPFPLLVGDAGDGEEGVAGVDVCAKTVHPADSVQLIGLDVGARGVDKAVFDVHGDDPTEDDARAANLHGGELLALKCGVGFGDARNFDDGGGRGGEAGHLEFVDARGEVGGADVHLFEQVFGDDVDDEFAGAADVARGVLGDGFAARAIGYANANDGRVSAEVVVRAKGCGVERALFVHAGDPGNGSRGYQADEQVVDLPMRCFFHVELHSYVLDVSLSHGLGERGKSTGYVCGR